MDLKDSQIKLISKFFDEADLNFEELVRSISAKHNHFLIELNKMGRICKNYNVIDKISEAEELISKTNKAYKTAN